MSVTKLRPIERLDEAKVDRIVEGCQDRLRSNSDNKWAMGDLLLAELPLIKQKGVAWHGGADAHRWYIWAVAERLNCSVTSLLSYRTIANHWPPEERYAGSSWSLHFRLRNHPERATLIRLSVREVEKRLGKAAPERADRRERDSDRSFANISKAAAAAIDVLSDDDVPAEKRVKFALRILVSFFEEAAAAS